MSILACLIGILTLMISVSMKTKNMDAREGLTEEELASATASRDLKTRLATVSAEIRKLEEKLGKDNQTASELARLETMKSQLRDQLGRMEKLAAMDPGETAHIRELEQRIAEVKKEQPALQKQLKETQTQIQTEESAPKPVQAILVKPGGLGSLGRRTLHFIECGSTGITIYQNGKPMPAIPTPDIETNPVYLGFLERLKKSPGSMAIFLIRKSGPDAYRWAVGVAETRYGITTAKLPIPNDGPIDLSLVR